MRSFIASLFAASVLANHEAQELNAIPADTNGYALSVWAVTGKLNFESQNIDTWYFGLELTTPKGDVVTSSSAKAKDLGTSAAETYVGQDGIVYQTYAQFDNPDASKSGAPAYESFNCSRVLSVKTTPQAFEVEDAEGYPQTVYANVTKETIGDAQVMNFLGNRELSETGSYNPFTYSNQLNFQKVGTRSEPSNQSDKGVWYAESEINSTVFLQQGYKEGSGSRKYNCVAQRSMEDSNSVVPSLIPKTTDLTFKTGFRIYDSVTATAPTLNQVSASLQITVMDSAIAMTTGAIVAATAMFAF